MIIKNAFCLKTACFSLLLGLLSFSVQAEEQTQQSAKAPFSADAAKKVHRVYSEWAGTRYRIGGTTKAGIDCSGFVRHTMKQAFRVNLPRSTAEQKTIGRSIKKSELRPGDLVFFRKNHHVGIYIGKGRFVHSSTSRGVITSSLSEKYWAKHYTQARRVM